MVVVVEKETITEANGDSGIKQGAVVRSAARVAAVGAVVKVQERWRRRGGRRRSR